MSKKRKKAQALVEFAIIIPFALLALTAIIEFGYAFYTWVAIGEVARIGTRYAVTGQYDPKYCDDAAAALSAEVPAWPDLAADDLTINEDGSTGTADCIVPSSVDDFEAKTAALQDWARIPSTRDAAMNGGSIGLLFDPGVSGDYIQFLSHPYPRSGILPNDGFKDDYRGDPTANGYISINICRIAAPIYGFAPGKYYYNGLTGNNDALYRGVCVSNDLYMDDAGGPGDRIRLTVTYNHPLIIPFFQALWPHLKLSTTQDAIVEKFRTSRLSGLSSGVSILDTYTPTPIPPTDTPTPTETNTPTLTPVPCDAPTGTGLLARFYAYGSDPWSNLVYTRIDPEVNFNWAGNPPAAGVPGTDFRVQWSGKVSPPYPGTYQFYTWSDDGVRLFIDGVQVITNWTDHGPTRDDSDPNPYLTCGQHSIILQYYQGTGGSSIQLGWQNDNIGDMLPIPQQYLYPDAGTLEPTSTYQTPTLTPTRTFTPSRTPTITPTPTITYTPSQTPTRSMTPTPSNTFTVTHTFTVTSTRTSTNTSTPVTPTHTFTATPYVPPSVTPTPSNTPTRTNTPTPKPTCGISSDAGGCTPVP
jgi:hypothetical protein